MVIGEEADEGRYCSVGKCPQVARGGCLVEGEGSRAENYNQLVYVILDLDSVKLL
jgi:hypothetical protein